MSLETISPQKTPEGVVSHGQIEPHNLDALRNLRGGSEYDVNFQVHPNRKVRRQIVNGYNYTGAEESDAISMRSERGQQLKTARRAMHQLETPLLPAKEIYMAAQHSVAPAGDIHRTAGTFHQEVIPTGIFSDNPHMMTDFVVDDRPSGDTVEHRALSSADLMTGHGLVAEDLDLMTEEEMAERGIGLWRPQVNEIVFAQNALHRAVRNRTGQDQWRTFGRAIDASTV